MKEHPGVQAIRELMLRLEAYPFTSPGGDLVNCADWAQLKDLFLSMAGEFLPPGEPTGQVFEINTGNIFDVPNDRGQRDRLIRELPSLATITDKARAKYGDMVIRVGKTKWTDDGIDAATGRLKLFGVTLDKVTL